MASETQRPRATAHHGLGRVEEWLCCLAALVLTTSSLGGTAWAAGFPDPLSGAGKPPIVLDRTGGFSIGGTVLRDPAAPDGDATLSCDHGYLEYFVPRPARRTSLVMWHSSSTQVWQNRWDGGEGYKDMFLRRGYPVWLWDGPRVGRANWGCAAYTYRPAYRDAGNFAGWNFGPSFMNWWPGVQFPTGDAEAWAQATAARYQEFDTGDNVELQSRAAAVAADSGKLGDRIVYLTNSAAGLRALMTAVQANGTNIAGIVAYECIGLVYPDNLDEILGPAPAAAANGSSTSNNNDPRLLPRPRPAPPGQEPGGFGPFFAPAADFAKLARLRGVQFVWGDHRNETSSSVRGSRLVAELINRAGGRAEVLMLAQDGGLRGSTHIPFADMDNAQVAAHLDYFLARHGLDSY